MLAIVLKGFVNERKVSIVAQGAQDLHGLRIVCCCSESPFVHLKLFPSKYNWNIRTCFFQTALVLFTLAIIQSIISGISLRISPSDEVTISRSLIESFKLARDNNPRHLRIWTTTESDVRFYLLYIIYIYRLYIFIGCILLIKENKILKVR